MPTVYDLISGLEFSTIKEIPKVDALLSANNFMPKVDDLECEVCLHHDTELEVA